MTDHTVTPNEWGIHGITLQPATITTIRFPDDVDEIEILSHDGAAPIYFTTDGTDPTVEGRAARVLPAAISSATVQPPTAGPTIIKLISAGSPKISVTRT